MKIAVIDDERPARRELIRQIQEVVSDCEIREADSGAGALLLLNEEDDFDILFVDINLNDMEGTTLAATAKKLLPQVKIVFATAYSQYAAKAFEMEIDDYILKPFAPDRVRHVLEKCMRGPLPARQKVPAESSPDDAAPHTRSWYGFLSLIPPESTDAPFYPPEEKPQSRTVS